MYVLVLALKEQFVSKILKELLRLIHSGEM